MEYPRTVILEDAKLEKLLKEKSDMILEGRKVSEDIDEKEREMDEIDKEVQEVEKKVDIADLRGEADALTARFNALTSEMSEVNNKIRERLHQIVPQELKDKYDNKKKEKEALESKRNKIALRVQKWNDKIIPLARKVMATFIQNEYEDYDSLRIENGKVVGTIFNHFEDWKKIFFSKKK